MPTGKRDFPAYTDSNRLLSNLPGPTILFPVVDLSRQFEPDNDRLFTWWAPWRNMREKNIGWRIDYVLASRGLAERATSCVAERPFGTSDHCPLTASFDWSPAAAPWDK